MAYRTGVATNANNNAPTVTVPATTQTGDVLLIQLSQNNTNVITSTPSSLTSLDSDTTVSTFPSNLYRVVVDGSTVAAGTVLNWGLSATRSWTISLSVWSGIDNTTPVLGTVAKAAGAVSTTVMPSITTSASAYLVEIGAAKSNGTTITSWTAPSGWTNRITAPALSTFSGSSNHADRDAGLAAAGTYGGETYTQNATPGATIRYIVALNPSSATVTIASAMSGTASMTAAATNATTVASGPAGSGSMTADLSDAEALSSTVTGVGTMGSAAINVSEAIAAAIAGLGSMTATVADTEPLTASLTGTGSMSAALTDTDPITATMTGSGTLSAALNESESLAATLSGSSSMSAAIAVAEPVTAGMSGAGTMTASLSADIDPLTATLGGSGTMTGDLTVISGPIVVAASMSGTSTVGLTNLIPNPSFETNTTGWIIGSGNSRQTTSAFDGSYGIQIVNSSGSSSAGVAIDPSGIAVKPNTTYTLSVRIKGSVTSGSVYCYIFDTVSNGQIVFTTISVTPNWTVFAATFTTSSTTSSLAVSVYGSGVYTISVDAFMLTTSPATDYVGTTPSVPLVNTENMATAITGTGTMAAAIKNTTTIAAGMSGSGTMTAVITASANPIAISDDFNDNIRNTSIWQVDGDSTRVLEQNTRLEVSHTAAAQYNSLRSLNTFSLIGHSFFAKVVDAGNQSLASHETIIGAHLDVNNKLWWTISQGILTPYKTVGGTISAVAVGLTYSPITHAFLRIRENGGTTFWDTSPDGDIWTNRFSAPNPFALTAIYPYLQTGDYLTEASGSYAYFDFFNTLPVLNQMTAAMSGSGTMSAALTRVLPVAGVMAGSGSMSAAIANIDTVAAAMSGAATVSATTALITSILAAMSGTSTVSTALGLMTSITAAISGAGTMNDTVNDTEPLSAVMAGAGSMTASINNIDVLVASMSGTGVMTARLVVDLLAQNMSGVGSMTASLADSETVSAAMSGSGSLTAILVAKTSLTAGLSGSSSGSAATNNSTTLSATASGGSNLTATLNNATKPTSALAGSSSMTGNLSDTEILTSAIAGAGTMNSSINNTDPVSAAMAGAGSMSNLLTDIIALAAALSGSGSGSSTVSNKTTIASSMSGSSSGAATPSNKTTVAVSMAGAGSLSGILNDTELLQASMTGSGSMAAGIANTDVLSAAISGSGSMSIVVVDATTVSAAMSGSSDLTSDYHMIVLFAGASMAGIAGMMATVTASRPALFKESRHTVNLRENSTRLGLATEGHAVALQQKPQPLYVKQL